MKIFIFVTLVSVGLPPMCAQAQPQEQPLDEGRLEVRQSAKELSEEYEKKLAAIEKDPDSTRINKLIHR